jgi:hypothetical protein
MIETFGFSVTSLVGLRYTILFSASKATEGLIRVSAEREVWTRWVGSSMKCFDDILSDPFRAEYEYDKRCWRSGNNLLEEMGT